MPVALLDTNAVSDLMRDHPQIKGRGYDHNLVLKRSGVGLSRAARIVEPRSRRTLTVTSSGAGNGK